MTEDAALPTLRIHDGFNDEVVNTARSAAAPDVPEWVYVDDRKLRTYGVVHRIDADEHTITACAWEPDGDASDDDIERMADGLGAFYREAPSGDGDAGGGTRVYYFKIDEQESFFQHRSPVVPREHTGVTIEGTGYTVFGSSVGVDDEGAYAMVTVSRDADTDDQPFPVVEAKRNLNGQLGKARTEWD